MIIPENPSHELSAAFRAPASATATTPNDRAQAGHCTTKDESMSKLTHLLATTDFSAPARHAVERAALVARETEAMLDLLHIATLAPLEKMRRLVAEMPAELGQRLLDAAREEMRELAASLHEHHGIAANARVVAGPLLRELESCADALPADLIVFGARGASFMRHLLLGSTAERMVSRATRPMLVVKQAAHERYRTLLIPVDFSPASLASVRNARAVAPGAELVLLHVFDVPFEGQLQFAGIDQDVIRHYRIAAQLEATEKLKTLCDEAGLSQRSTRLIVLHGDPSLRIIEQEQEQDCDLIVMGRQGEKDIEDLLLGSVTRQVLAGSQCDVLISV
jgi:nucleotide-binding universal stress UspA family protein